MDISDLVPMMPDGTPGYGPIPLMPAPSAVAMGPIETDQGTALLLTVYFANGQASFVFDQESAESLVDEMKEHLADMKSPDIIVPTKPKNNGLFLP